MPQETKIIAIKKRSPGRPKKSAQRSEDIEQKILSYAKTLFRQKGFSSVSMRDIVNGVGISLPTLYYYFSDKETLFTAIVVYMMNVGNKHFAGEINWELPLQDNLRHLAIGYMEFSPTSMTSMMRDVDEHISQEHTDQILKAYDTCIAGPFRELFKQARERGELQKFDDQTINDVTNVFLGLLDAFRVSMVSQFGKEFNFEHYGNLSVDIFLDGVLKHDLK